MTRRIILYLAITIALITQIVVLNHNITLEQIQARLPIKERVSDISTELAAIEIPLPEPTYAPLPKGEFLSSHAKVERSDRDKWVLSEEFVYVDSFGKKWVAPAGTVTDGASIPQAFLSATGDRLDGDYLDAAVVHDAYCSQDNAGLDVYQTETWQYVHYMFYEALLTNGVPEQQAKIMYTAVYMGGPRWGEDVVVDGAVVIGSKEIDQRDDTFQVDTNSSLRVDPSEPTAEEIAEFEAMLAWIESENPTGEELRAELESN